MLGYYDRRDNQYCCNVLSIPVATTWPEQRFSTLRRVKTKQWSRLFDLTLNALINVSMNGPESLQYASRLCSGSWHSENWQKLQWFIVFHISILGVGSFVWGVNCAKVPHGDETGSRPAQWWGRSWKCSWNLWLKWIKANNKRRVTQRALKTLESADEE